MCESFADEETTELLEIARLIIDSLIVMQSFADEDIPELLETLDERLREQVVAMSSLEKYRKEVLSGQLDWGPMHTSTQFWQVCPHASPLLRCLLTLTFTALQARQTLRQVCAVIMPSLHSVAWNIAHAPHAIIRAFAAHIRCAAVPNTSNIGIKATLVKHEPKNLQENAEAMEDKDCQLVRQLIKLAGDGSTMSAKALAVAASDLGMFCTAHANGRFIVNDLGGKSPMMRLMQHPDAEVRHRSHVCACCNCGSGFLVCEVIQQARDEHFAETSLHAPCVAVLLERARVSMQRVFATLAGLRAPPRACESQHGSCG